MNAPTLRLVPSKRTEIVIEDHESYVVTVDMEDEPPQHNHRDIFDGPGDEHGFVEGVCPRCDWDVERAEG